MSGGFILLDFPEGISEPVAYFDHATGGQLEHDAKVVARLSEVYDELTGRALSAKDSTAFIAGWI